MRYPLWNYFPRNERPTDWARQLVEVIAQAETEISTRESNGPSSDEVLGLIAPGMVSLGYVVERSKSKQDRIRRPVLFGDNGQEDVSYEIDAFHDGFGIAVEVEAGRGAQNNADYRDLIRASLILDAYYLAALPLGSTFG